MNESTKFNFDLFCKYIQIKENNEAFMENNNAIDIIKENLSNLIEKMKNSQF